MSDSEILFKAAINRITARITQKLIDSAQEFSEIAEEIPQRLQEDWSNFKDEVIEESARLEKERNSSKQEDSNQPSTKEEVRYLKFNNQLQLLDEHYNKLDLICKQKKENDLIISNSGEVLLMKKLQKIFLKQQLQQQK